MTILKISISDLGYFSGCRRQWYWGNIYTPKYPPPAYFVGSAAHEGLETYYKTRDSQQVTDAVEKFIDKTLQDVSDNPIEYGGESSIEQYEELAELSRQMVANYLRYDAELPFQGKVEEIESTIRIKIPHPDEEPTMIILSGRIDLIISDDQGGLWIVDHKTSSSYTPGLPGLDVDEQLTGYMYLVWKRTGIVPKGVIYNVLLKKAPSAPRLLKNGDLSQDKSQATTYDLYMKEIAALGQDPFKYDSMLTYLKEKGWDGFFFREAAGRNLHELKSFEERVLVKAADIARIYLNPDVWAYPSPSTYSCNYCQYLSACKSKEDGGDYKTILETRFTVRPTD